MNQSGLCCSHVSLTGETSICRECGKKGISVKEITIRSILKQSKLGILKRFEGFYFCETPVCDVVYFNNNEPKLYFHKDDVKVRVGIKETEDPIPLCYCFGWTRERIFDQIKEQGHSTAVQEITAKVKAGECACEIKNPSGRCCLGDVTRAVKRGIELSSKVAGTERGGIKFADIPLIGSMLAAIAASICCVGPAILAVVGAGGVGWFSRFSELRPYLIGITAVLVALAFYGTYRKKRISCQDGSCKIRTAGKWNKIALWVGTILVSFFLAFPYLNLTDATSLADLRKEEVNVDKRDVSFYTVPLVCGAAPQIGCGGKAKPVLLSLENNKDIVSEAWLNRPGTVMAIVWQENSPSHLRSAVLDSVFRENKINGQELTAKQHRKALKEFEEKQNWYRAGGVDELSMEEAHIIAERLLRRINAKASLSKEKTQRLKKEFGDVLTERFTQSYSNKIDQEERKIVGKIQPEIEDELLQVGNKYLSENEMLMLKEALSLGYRPLPSEENQALKRTSSKAQISEVILCVKGMTCSACELNVENAVKKLDGVLEAKADYRKGEVYIAFEMGKVTTGDIIEAIKRSGYDAVKR